MELKSKKKATRPMVTILTIHMALDRIVNNKDTNNCYPLYVLKLITERD